MRSLLACLVILGVACAKPQEHSIEGRWLDESQEVSGKQVVIYNFDPEGKVDETTLLLGPDFEVRSGSYIFDGENLTIETNRMVSAAGGDWQPEKLTRHWLMGNKGA